MDAVWPDYRRDEDPLSCRAAAAELHRLAAAHPELLIVPVCSIDVNAVYPRCETVAGFPQVSAAAVKRILGYA